MGRKFVKVGEDYGKIHVSGIADKSYRAYNCVCSVCGREFVISGQDVFKYADTGCGVCRTERRQKDRLEDAEKYIGQQFGALKVLSVSGTAYMYGHNNTMVTCECRNCGDVSDYVLAKLKASQVKQCKNCGRQFLKEGHEIMKDSHVAGTSVLSIDGRRKINKNNTSGAKGVSKDPKTGKYRAYIHFRRKQYSLGVYSDIDDAIDARKEAEKEIYGNFLDWYSANHPEQWKRIRK